MQFLLIFCIRNFKYIKSYNNIIFINLLFIYQFIYIFFHLPTYLSFLYLLRNLVEKWSLLLVIEIYFISLFHFFIDQFFQVYFKLLGILLLSYHLEKLLHDSICRNFIGLMWLDWIGLEWTGLCWIGLECGLFWMALHSYGQHRTTLKRTSLDSAGLHWARHCTPDRNTPHCTRTHKTANKDW